MTISGKNILRLKNVLVGEVWLCSGQSNMGWPLAPRPEAKELQGTENARIRLFTVPPRMDDVPRQDMAETHWQECGPKTVGTFSAVAYFFGRELQKTLKVPIGLIHASYGGSQAAFWIDPDTLAKDPGLDSFRQRQIRPKLYNGMIAPLVPYGIRGVIWYQGEADTGDAAAYRQIFPALIQGWRSEWGEGDFPFLFVQIAPYGRIVSSRRRAAQQPCGSERLTSLTVPDTAMIVVTDWGHEVRIHTPHKEPPGSAPCPCRAGVGVWGAGRLFRAFLCEHEIGGAEGGA